MEIREQIAELLKKDDDFCEPPTPCPDDRNCWLCIADHILALKVGDKTLLQIIEEAK